MPRREFSELTRETAAKVLLILRGGRRSQRFMSDHLEVGRATVSRAVNYLRSLDLEIPSQDGMFGCVWLSTKDRMRLNAAGDVRAADIGARAVCLSLEQTCGLEMGEVE